MVIPKEERIRSAWVLTVGVIRALMVVVLRTSQVWHNCSYKQVEVVLPYIYFGCLRPLGGRGDRVWALRLDYVEVGKFMY